MKKNQSKASYEIQTLMISPLENITYLVFDHQTKQCALIDSPWDIRTVLETIEQRGYQLSSVLMTHTHIDHIKDLTELFTLFEQKDQKLDIYISKTEAEFWGEEFDKLPAKQKYYLKDNQSFQLGSTQIKAIFAL